MSKKNFKKGKIIYKQDRLRPFSMNAVRGSIFLKACIFSKFIIGQIIAEKLKRNNKRKINMS
jgi:hypothetical protein